MPTAPPPGGVAGPGGAPPLAPRLPPQATMGLLEYLTAHALDEDYAHVAEQRRAQADPDAEQGAHDGHDRGRRRPGWFAAAALACFTLLVVVAAVQTSQGAAADARQRQQLGAQVEAQRERLAAERDRVRSLEVLTDRLQRQQLASDASATGLRDRVDLLGSLAGTVPVRGPGVEVVVDDAPGSDSDRTRVLDTDLQRLVNGLWAAGAEAISVNGQRLTNLSTIRIAGDAITVNNRGLRAPYRLLVLADPDTLPARFAETASGQAWLDLQRQVGLRLSLTPAESLRLPAAAPSLRYAAAVRDTRPGAGSGGGDDRSSDGSTAGEDQEETP